MKKLIVLTAAVVLSLIVSQAYAATLITDWTFETSLPTGTSSTITLVAETGTGTAIGSHASATTAWSNPVGNGSSDSWSSNQFALGDYYEFQTSTTGFGTISLSWDQTSSNTGPRDFILQYSLNGTSFTTSGAQYSVLPNAGNFWTAGTHYQEYSTTRAGISTSLDNQAIVYFRLVVNSTTSAIGAAIATAGTARLDSFKVLGIAPLANPSYWDVNGNTAGLGGTGTWDTTTTNFNSSATGTGGTVSAWDSSKSAVFGGTAGTVTVAGAGGVTTNGGIQFDVNGYTVTGTTITLGTTATIQVTNPSDTATISARLDGLNGLTVSGSGTTVLATTNVFQGLITVNGATLSVSHDSNMGDANNGLTISSGTFRVTDNVSMPSSRAFTIDGSGTVDVAATKTLTVAGAANGGDVELTNSGNVVLTNATKSLGTVVFSKDGTLRFDSGSGTASLGGNIQSSATSGTATVNGSVNFGATIRSISVSNANATLVVTGNLSNAGQMNVTGTGTVDLQGDNSGLTNATTMQIGQVGSVGPKLIVHNANSLGNTAATQVNFNSGTIFAASAVTINSNVVQSLGSASSAATQATNKYDGANLTFLGSVHLFNNNTLDQRITVNNTTTFAGGWTASTGTTASPSVVINGSSSGKLVLAGTIDLEKPVAIQTATVQVNGTMTNAAATFLVTSGGTLRTGVTNALPTAGSVTVGTTGLSTTIAATTGTYDLAANQTLGTVHLIGGSITGSANTLTSTSDYDARDGLISARLGGGVGLVKGTGVFTNVLTLSGNNTYTGATTVNDGTLIVAHVNGLGDPALTINNTALTQLQAGLTGPVQVDSLTIAGGVSPTATLDITDNNMIVHNGDLATMTAQVANGAFNGGDGLWTGTGITSSTAAFDAANAAGDKAVGIILNDDLFGNTIYSDWPSGADSGGQVSVNLTDVLVKYTLFGDANLDGITDTALDYSLWATGNSDPGTFTGWLYGDFNYDGTVDASIDYSLWATGNASPDQGLGGGVQPVPEPSTLVLAALGLAGVAACARRRRNAS